MTAHRPPFRDPALPVARRVDDLLDRLTADERLALLHQFTPGVERLGLAAFRTGQEALHGVAWSGPATVFPQAVGLGASWHPELVRRVGEAVSRETRAMRAKDGRVGLNVWSPTVNLLRNPLWGRGEEGYAEDPTLTSAIATAFTRGLRGDHPLYWRTAPVLKHWLAHNNEAARDTSSASVRPRVLREYDLRAFRGAVEAGAVAGVMPAYNLVNGRPNHLSPYLEEELRSWTDQELLVCSDAGAPSNLADSQGYFATHEEAVAAALRAGVDSFTDHGTDASVILGRLRGALERGLIDAADVKRAVRRQLTVRCLLGEFDPELDPYADESRFDTPEHRELAREAAEAAVVLLKNESSPRGPLLPLAAGTRIAVVGLLADTAKLDWYSGSLLHRSTPLDGLRERFGRERVTFAEGVDRIRLRTASGTRLRVAESGSPGPDGSQDTVPDVDGSLDPALIAGRTDLPPLTADTEGSELALIDWGDGVLTLRAPDGRYLSVAEDGFVRASADEPGGWVVQETFRLEPLEAHEAHDGGHLLLHLGTGGYVSVAADGVKVAADRASAEVFSVETVERGEDAVARAAAGADVVIVVAGNDPHVNGRETEDRTTLALPAHQDRLWRAAHAANPRTVLVLVSSYPYAVPEAAALLPALLWTAHGGQAAGTALARILAGDVSPAGRLPQTWYAADADLAGMLDYDVIGGRQTYLYFDGTPLFPFGHGLSYTTFAYEQLTAAVDGEEVRISCTVTNTGAVASDEVVQVYGRAVKPSVPRPHRELLAHERVHLAPGASTALSFTVPVVALGFWDVARGRWAVDPGPYEFLAGTSSADVRRRVRVEVPGTAPGPRPVLETGLEAVDYDEQTATVIVDRSRVSGDAVTPADPDVPGTLLYRACDFGEGVTELAVTAAGAGEVTFFAGTGTAELARVTVEPTDGPYDHTTVGAPCDVRDVTDIRVELCGPLRLAHVAFSG
ncbi:beta-glucosidase [Streptomyces gardneri]|uniref:Exo-alpha-(1->6)-L-arabinopyranosidase n=1 Tax=Streptomyces gardneri TaxID=66892 RepID=A0A4Y3RCC3_9ACTN|nr:glycoside hydrolase family 3 C-terminal domain-containing protein [Streptomyces gardneri]GEB55421.1 sugar hydrolase [Streptomyces gardneri]GHH10148.1 sugar hydrolase [Streptomyces gardneri]